MTAWAIDTLIGVTLVTLLVLAVRRPVARHFGAAWAYRLWLLPLARLFVPPLDLIGGPAASLPSYTVIVVPNADAAGAAEAAAGFDWLALLAALWLGGAAMFALWQQSTYSAFVMSLGPGRKARPPQHGGIPVVECDAVDGPVAIGFLKRRIVVPADFTSRWSPAERRLALEHELTHHRRGDLWWNLIALGMLGLNWFNPVAWFAFRAFRADQELACDAAVTAGLSGERRQDYARAVVKAASAPGQIATCPLNQVDQLKDRLRMMREHRLSRGRTAGGMTALALLAGLGFALAAPGLAREAPLPAPALVIDAGGAPSPVLAPREVAVLQERCAAARVIDEVAFYRRSGPEGLILCSDGKVVDDPEVRAIVARAAVRSAAAEAPAAPAVPPAPAPAAQAAAPAEPAEPAAAAPPKPARMVRIVHTGHMSAEAIAAARADAHEIRREVARARAEMERELGPVRAALVEAALAKAKVEGLDAERLAARVERELAARAPEIERQVELALAQAGRIPDAPPPSAAPRPPRPPRF